MILFLSVVAEGVCVSSDMTQLEECGRCCCATDPEIVFEIVRLQQQITI